MKCKLADIADVTMGQSPKSEYYNTNGEGYPFLQGNRTFGFKRPIFDTYTTVMTKLAKAGDVIMSVRAPVGELNITPVDMCLGRGVCSLRMKNGNQDFLYYLMQYMKPYLVSRESGSIFGSVNRNDINSLELDIPFDEEEQRRIGRYLGMLDDKIELNNRINDNLQQQMQAIFNSFFYEFTTMSNDLSSEIFDRILPPGWKIMELGDANLDISDGNYSAKYPKQHEFLPSGIPFIRGTDFAGTTISQDDLLYISQEKHRELKKGHTKKGDILITTRGDIGRIAFVPDSLVDVNINSQLVRINGAGVVPRSYLACFLVSKHVQMGFKYLTSGTALQQLPIGKLKKVMFLIPDSKTLERFDSIVEPQFQRMFANSEENIRLSQIRDALLPKLMSGEINVSDIAI